MSCWKESVEAYHRYGLDFPQYTRTNQKLVEISELRERQRVVDLASGTGFTTKTIISKLSNADIYAVDSSSEMLRKARE